MVTAASRVPFDESAGDHRHQLPSLQAVIDDDAGDQDLAHASTERVDFLQLCVGFIEHTQLDVARARTSDAAGLAFRAA